MTDKEKKIKEIVEKVLRERTDITHIPDLAEPIAEALYNAGYRKVGEGDIIITEDENFENLKHIATCVRKLKTKIRKDTAKEILNKVKERSVWFIENPTQKDHFSEQMQELFKEYGVEIGQCETVCPVCGKEMDGTEHGRQYCENCKAKFEGKE